MNRLAARLALAAFLALGSASAHAATEQQCLDFLQTYLPMPDTVDTSREFLLQNVRLALQARAEMPWGADVPEREWMHFVLPMRVNNEWLDSCRAVFFAELKPRVQGLSMTDAILEVNHWCHEKATYQPSDGRTHSPLLTVYTHLGRCGEESTFAVAALRAVGIPARQVYTPRWAHTDDNHAWVEAWADGRWWFLGACEPEPVLNLGWFNSAAARGMLMNTRVIGSDYDGPEEVLVRAPQYVDINVTDNYAPVDTLHVAVTRHDGSPLPGARVTFRLYNYGEFYPIATKTASESGHAQLTAGMGDLLVWASDPATGLYDYVKARPGQSVTLVPGRAPQAMDVTMVPPVPGGSTPPVTPAQATACEARKAYEDSLRTAVPFSHPVPERFVASQPTAELAAKARALIGSLSDKDRRDVTERVLADHLATPEVDTPLFTDYVLCPRVASEELSAWRSFFASTLCATDSAALYRANPQLWVEWVRRNVDASLGWYPPSLTLHPATVWRLRKGSPLSRDVFFVAAARSLGIPARIDPVTGKTQWADASCRWHDADFAPAASATEEVTPATLMLAYEQVGRIDDPKYYVNFTLSRIGANGEPQLLEYPEDATWRSTFAAPAELDPGSYLLVTGQRLADGTVLSRMERIDLPAGGVVTHPLDIRQDTTAIQVIGAFNAENLYSPADGSPARSLLSTAGRGYYVVGLIQPNHEPSAHVLNDLIAAAPELERAGRSIILLFDSPESLARFDRSRFTGLPSTVVLGVDPDGSIAAELTDGLKLTPGERPVVAVVDSFNRVLTVVQGYSIGLGHRLAEIFDKLN